MSKDFDNTISFTALGNTHVFSTYAGTLPAPTPKAGFPHEYAALTIALPPVAKIVAIPGWFINALVAYIDLIDNHWIQFSGAPAAIAASLITIAACFELSWALGWNEKMIGFLVFKAINDLKITVEVGLVVGTIPQTTPTGSAISVIPVNGSSLMIPTVFKWRKLLVTYSHANKFLTALSSNTPRPVSLTAASAKIPWWSSPATEHLATM